MNESKFFAVCRAELFGGSMTQSQVDGLNNILTAISPFTLAEKAYMLATVYWETAKTMRPISERGRGRFRPYGQWYKNSKGVLYCFKDGSRTDVYTKDECDEFFYGRGYVQLTWWINYWRMTKILQGIGMLTVEQSLVKTPELANDPSIAAMIMCYGMRDGLFTGKKLSDYFGKGKKDYVGARKIINGTDKQHQIAAIAVIFERALS